jgi:prepilin-type N-terminal cleavage/methylation domain-containing protein
MNMKNKKEKKGLTLIELLLTVSLISLISFTLYRALINGFGVWNRSQQMVVEEDISIFFDRLAKDLRNTFVFSKIPFEGTEYSIAFPTMINTSADPYSGLAKDELVEQIGRVRYYFDFIEDGLFKEEANYSQSQNYMYGKPRLLVSSIDRVQFRYYYRTDHDEISSDSAFESMPAGIEVEVRFTDPKGSRIIKRYIDIPINS